MKRKTYRNVMRATKILQNKGYEFQEAAEMAIKVFDEHENGEIPIEFYLDKIVTKDEFLQSYQK